MLVSGRAPPDSTSGAGLRHAQNQKISGQLPLLERLTPEAHVFSHESGREILSFIVNTNLQWDPGSRLEVKRKQSSNELQRIVSRDL